MDEHITISNYGLNEKGRYGQSEPPDGYVIAEFDFPDERGLPQNLTTKHGKRGMVTTYSTNWSKPDGSRRVWSRQRREISRGLN